MRLAGQHDLAQRQGEFVRILELMPGLGANDASDHREHHHVQRIGVHAAANEVAMQYPGSTDRRQPKQQTEGANVREAKV